MTIDAIDFDQLSTGTLALVAPPIADHLGPTYSMRVWSIVFNIDVVIQTASETSWMQVALSTLVAGACRCPSQ